MVTSSAQLHGSALIGHSYHIDIRVGRTNEYSSDISIVEGIGTGPMAHQSRSLLRAAADKIGNNINFFEVDPRERPHFRPAYIPDAAKEDKKIQGERTCSIKKKAQQSAGRKPESKERQAMAKIQSMAQSIARTARSSAKFGVKQQTHFKVITIRDHGTCKARLYTEPQGKLIKSGAGVDHYAAMKELLEEVGRRDSKKEVEKLRAGEAKHPSKSRSLF